MKKYLSFILVIFIAFSLLGVQTFTVQPVKIKNRIKVVKQDMFAQFNSFNQPRPMKNSINVPIKTSFYIKLEIPTDNTDKIIPSSVAVSLQAEGIDPFYILSENKIYSPGYSGTLKQLGNIFEIFIDTGVELEPSTKYTIKISALTKEGYGIFDRDSTWSFTTADKFKDYSIDYTLDVNFKPDVKWNGRFFSGLLHPDFDTVEEYGTERFDYIFDDNIKEQYPDAWQLFRLHRVTGFDWMSTGFLPTNEANIVREMETRRITDIDENSEGVLLTVEDFFGHEQYGIESNRPLSTDYMPGDEIIIHDTENNERAFVVSTDDINRTVLVSKFTQPSGSWKIKYTNPLPKKEKLSSPGLFSTGGTYLRKFNPVGTPVYYWGRIDHAFDQMAVEYGQRLALGFIEAPGDLSIDGMPTTTAKDMVQLHKVTYDITSHLINRYGDVTLNWVWSIFNEPDLINYYWRNNDWIELQRFYDYSVDAVLKAFEDKGYDSNMVFIGGLELGGILGTNLRIEEFLAHCSPTAARDGALLKNAAYEDSRLDGKRSKRVEDLCSANNGQGSPLDFISIHTYNNSETAAAKIIHAKQVALNIDAEYYRDLWINNFESVPEWSGFEDPGASEWTLGNGYLPSWTSDYIGRLLQKSASDPRFSHGESILTIWGFPSDNFTYLNDVVTKISIGDKVEERTVIIPKPVFHYVNLLSTMTNDYWVFPQKEVEGHTISGFASPTEKDIRLLLYTHDMEDTQSKSDNTFNINVNIKGLEFDEIMVTEYQFDKVNNTYYPFAAKNKERNLFTETELRQIEQLSKLRATNVTTYQLDSDGSLSLDLPLAANGVNFVVISKTDVISKTPGENSEQNTPADFPKGIKYIFIIILLSGLLIFLLIKVFRFVYKRK